MTLLIILLVVSIPAAVSGWYIAICGARALLRQDSDWGQVVEILSTYSMELEKMTSGDILTDHPEVLRFHRLNMNILRLVNEVVESSGRRRLPEPKEKLPRPDVE